MQKKDDILRKKEGEKVRKRRKRKTAMLLAAVLLASIRTGTAKPIDVYAAGEVRAGILISGSSGYTEKIPDGMFTSGHKER